MSDKSPSIKRIAELQQFIGDFAKVLRVPQLADTGRAENDVEHSYGLVLTCWFLAPKIAAELDLSKILQYAIAHDVVEIHAGDTFIYGSPEALASKSKREDEALEKLAKEWPDFNEMVNAAQGYKDKRDEESKFVYAVDKILPTIMVNLDEKSAFWNRHKITLEMMKNSKTKSIKVSPQVAPYFDKLVAWLTESDHFYKPDSSSQQM